MQFIDFFKVVRHWVGGNQWPSVLLAFSCNALKRGSIKVNAMAMAGLSVCS